jgi:uncharacterized protein YfiM (DUF2279 family)
MTRLLFIVLLMIYSQTSYGNDSALINNNDSISYFKRQKLCIGIGIGGTVLTHAALYQLWYRGYASQSFTFINDNKEWMQMDKAGHAFSAYYLSYTGIESAKWAGVSAKNQWKWGLMGVIFQTPIEVFDGFSQGWGASTGDLIANTVGSALCIGQEALWQDQFIKLKFSYSPSQYAALRPNTLGNSLQTSLLKDYNAQTYWLTYSPLKKTKVAYLGLALGMGANGLIGGYENKWFDKSSKQQIDRTDLLRYRQYYLALDFDFTKLKTKSKALKKVFFVLNCIKVPSPTLEWSQNKLRGHWLHF